MVTSEEGKDHVLFLKFTLTFTIQVVPSPDLCKTAQTNELHNMIKLKSPTYVLFCTAEHISSLSPPLVIVQSCPPCVLLMPLIAILQKYMAEISGDFVHSAIYGKFDVRKNSNQSLELSRLSSIVCVCVGGRNG